MTTTYYQHLGRLNDGDIFGMAFGPRHELYSCAGCGTVVTVPAVHAKVCDHQATGFSRQPGDCQHQRGWLWLVEVIVTDDGAVQGDKDLRCVDCGASAKERAISAADIEKQRDALLDNPTIPKDPR